MKYSLYHFRRIQGGWFNQGTVAFAASKREAPAAARSVRGYPSSDDDAYIWLLTDTAPKQIACGPCGCFTLKSAI